MSTNMSLHNFFSIAATAVILAACSDLTISEQTGTAPDAAAMTADPAISLRAAQSPDNTISITLNHGEGSATAYISAIADKPLQYAQTLRLVPASEQFVADWSDSTGIDYKLLPTAFYALGSGNTLDIPAGSTCSAENLLTVYSRNLFGTVIDAGRYLLPLVATSSLYEVKDSTILVDVTIREKYVTPEGIELYTGDDMFTVYYLNTAEFDPRLACEMVLEDIFDQNIFPERLVGLGNIIVLRSSMLSYDESTGKVGIEPGNDMRYILEHWTERVLPVQETGRKVCLCIDGGGKGVGFCNLIDFQIDQFVTAAKRLVDTYGIDGVNLWDRNSAYNLVEEKGLPPVNTTSYPKLIKALKEALGQDKLVTVTDHGEPTEYFGDVQAMGGIEVGRYIDYAWHGYCDNTEPIQIVDPWHPDAPMVSASYKRSPIAGLSPERYGCVHTTSYPGRTDFEIKSENITEWVKAGYNPNGISVFYDIHSNRQDEFEAGHTNYPDFVIIAWMDVVGIQLYTNLWSDNVGYSGYNAWVKDW